MDGVLFRGPFQTAQEFAPGWFKRSTLGRHSITIVEESDCESISKLSTQAS